MIDNVWEDHFDLVGYGLRIQTRKFQNILSNTLTHYVPVLKDLTQI